MPSWKKVITSGSNAALNSLNVTTAFTASGLNYPTTDNGEGSFLQTNGSGNLSFQYVKTIYEEIVNGEATQLVKGTPVYVSGSQGAASIVYRADAGNASKMPVIYISADNIASGATGRGIALGLITGVNTTGYPPGTEIYVAVGGGWTSTRPTGSAIVQTLGYVTKEGNGGQGVVLNPGPNSLPNLPSGRVWVGNSNSIPVAVPTSSLNVASASFASTSSFTTAVSGTTNYVPKFTGSNTLGNSQIFDNGTNVGIGTTSPTSKLHIVGDVYTSTGYIAADKSYMNSIGNTITNNNANLSLTTSGVRTSRNIADSNTVFAVINQNASSTGPIQTWNNSGGELMRVTQNGNVGIGVTTPSAKLDVRAQGALATDIAFRVRNSTNTRDFLVVNGAGDVYNNGAGGGETNTHFGVNTARNRTGAYNSTFGNEAGRDLTTGAGNTLFGYNAGRNITTQGNNTFIGPRAGESNIGNYNTAVGANALLLNTTGGGNIAIGAEALYYNTTAFGNTALGNEAGFNNTTGGRNFFLGTSSGRSNTTGQSNICIGVDSAFAQTTGNNNIFVGDGSGRYLADGVTNLTISNNSLFLGRDTRANDDNQINQIVIGDGAIGLGSNSVVLGNESTVTTALRGNVGIGTTAPSTLLDVNGIITAIGGNSTQWNSKQEALVSGTNIKTLNGNNVLGSGDLSTKGIHTLVKPAVGETTSFLLYGQTIGNVVGQANRLIAVPYIPATTITCSSLYINISTALAGSNARILIYSDDNGKPGTKIYESANLNCSTTGIKTATTTQTFNAGTIYWICSHSSSTQTFSSANPAALIPINVSGISVFTSYYITPTFGSAPTTFGTGTFIQLALPFIGIKI